MTVAQEPVAPGRQLRHQIFLRKHCAAVAAAAPIASAQRGRGAWIINYSRPGAPAPANLQFLADSDAQAAPLGWDSAAIAGMVASYDPAREAVMLVQDLDGTTTAYRMGLPGPAGGGS